MSYYPLNLHRDWSRKYNVRTHEIFTINFRNSLMARSACNAVALVMLHVVNIHLFSSKINMQDGDLKVIVVIYGIKMSNMYRCNGYLLIFIIRILQATSNFVYLNYICQALLLVIFPDSGNPCLFSDTDIGKKKKDIILLVRVWNQHYIYTRSSVHIVMVVPLASPKVDGHLVFYDCFNDDILQRKDNYK